jgi:sec1 family domain-containing protein 1
MMTSQPTQTSAQQPTDTLFKGFSSLSNRLTDRFKDNLPIGTSLDTLISGVKNFLPANRDLTITQIVQSIMDPANSSSSALQKSESYLFFDPRASSSGRGGIGPDGRPLQGPGQSFGQRRQGFQEGIVFTVGGGNMEEYGNLQEWSKRTGGPNGSAARKKVVYGSTELVNAEQFVNGELAKLGMEG